MAVSVVSLNSTSSTSVSCSGVKKRAVKMTVTAICAPIAAATSQRSLALNGT